MLDKRDYRIYQNVQPEQVYPQVCDFWARQGFYVGQISPFEIQGQSYLPRIGLRREFYLKLTDHNGDTSVDLYFRGKVTDEGLLGGAAATIIFFPVALVGGAISYSEFEKDARNIIGGFWSFIDRLTGVQNFIAAPPPYIPPAASNGSTACTGCGAFLLNNWVSCPYCGQSK